MIQLVLTGSCSHSRRLDYKKAPPNRSGGLFQIPLGFIKNQYFDVRVSTSGQNRTVFRAIAINCRKRRGSTRSALEQTAREPHRLRGRHEGLRGGVNLGARRDGLGRGVNRSAARRRGGVANGPLPLGAARSELHPRHPHPLRAASGSGRTRSGHNARRRRRGASLLGSAARSR